MCGSTFKSAAMSKATHGLEKTGLEHTNIVYVLTTCVWTWRNFATSSTPSNQWTCHWNTPRLQGVWWAANEMQMIGVANWKSWLKHSICWAWAPLQEEQLHPGQTWWWVMPFIVAPSWATFSIPPCTILSFRQLNTFDANIESSKRFHISLIVHQLISIGLNCRMCNSDQTVVTCSNNKSY